MVVQIYNLYRMSVKQIKGQVNVYNCDNLVRIFTSPIV